MIDMEYTVDYWNSYIYSSPQKIITELEKRRSDLILKKMVGEFLGDHFPHFISDDSKQYGFFSRPLITPNREVHFFTDVVSDFGVEPLFLEYPDKFVSVNRSKYYLAKLSCNNRLVDGRANLTKKTLVDIQACEGKMLDEIKLINDTQTLRDFHRNFFTQEFPQYKNSLFNIKDWFNKIRNVYGEYYYLGYLALGIYHGVIFENFLLDDKREREFFEKKVWPSFLRVEELFNCKPLLSPVLPMRMAKLDDWNFYPRLPE